MYKKDSPQKESPDFNFVHGVFAHASQMIDLEQALARKASKLDPIEALRHE